MIKNRDINNLQRVQNSPRWALLFCVVICLSACVSQSSVPTVTLKPSATITQPPTATRTPTMPPPTPSLSPTVLVPTVTPWPRICSPLEGIEIADLDALIVNEFNPPQLGSDDPHQGVDIAEIDSLYQLALEGLPVHSVTDGIVAGVIENRFPYGNAILIETSFDQFPESRLADIQMPTPAPQRTGHPSLTCPTGEASPDWDQTQRSLYLLYAHLQEPPTLLIGETIKCGQALNSIGNTGNSLNPHLHLEMRVGPAKTTFESLAHYTSSASPREMYNYCLWRVSETFQLLDPMQFFVVNPK